LAALVFGRSSFFPFFCFSRLHFKTAFRLLATPTLLPLMVTLFNSRFNFCSWMSTAEKRFKVLAEEYGVNFFLWSYHGDGFASPLMKPYLGTYLPQLVVVMRENKGAWGCDEKNWLMLGRMIITGLEQKSLDVDALRAKTKNVGEDLIQQSLALTPARIAKMSEAEMAAWMEPAWRASADVVAMGFIPVASDFHHNLLTNRLEDILAEHMGPRTHMTAKEYLALLCSNALSEHSWAETKAAYELAVQVAQTAKGKTDADFFKHHPTLQNALARHVEKYAWIFYGYEGPLWSEKQFAERILKMAQGNPQSEWAAKLQERDELAEKQHHAMDELGLNEDERALFHAAQTFLYMKSYRMDVRSVTSSRFDLIFQELERRHGIALRVWRCAELDGILAFLKSGDKSALTDAEKRTSFFVCTWLKGKKIFRYGAEADDYLNTMQLKDAVQKTDELKGQVACTGLVRGRVKIVNTVADILKVLHGDVLVSLATSPDLLPAMHRARAFVTVGGGITSHAAIVSREMKKPCLVGVRHATELLKDGDLVEVDANNGFVRILPG